MKFPTFLFLLALINILRLAVMGSIGIDPSALEALISGLFFIFTSLVHGLNRRGRKERFYITFLTLLSLLTIGVFGSVIILGAVYQASLLIICVTATIGMGIVAHFTS